MILDTDPKFLGHGAGIGVDTQGILSSFRDLGWSISPISQKSKLLLTGKIRKLQDFLVALGKNPLVIPKGIDSIVQYLPHISGAAPSELVPAIWRIHDIFPISHPEWFTKQGAMLFTNTLKNIDFSKSYFLFNSEYSKSEFLNRYPLEENRAEVVFPVPRDLTLTTSCDKCRGCQMRWDEKPFMLTVSTIEPRKNTELLLETWHSTKIAKEADLILVGDMGWKTPNSLKTRLRNPPNCVRYLGVICDFALGQIYSRAVGYISASFDEGFDIPAEQARVYGVPLFLSDTPVHIEIHSRPETNFFDPCSISELLNCLQKSSYRREFLEENQNVTRTAQSVKLQSSLKRWSLV